MNINDRRVLVLNAFQVAINEISVKEAFLMMAADAATALDTSDNCFVPMSWDKWLQLLVREGDDFVGTPRGQVRVPRVIVAVNHAQVVLKRPRLTMTALRKRDGGKCAYTGEVIDPKDGSMEHVVPKSKGGRKAWTNIVYAHRKVNSARGNRKLKKGELKARPYAPAAVPPAAFITPKFPEWESFLRRGGRSA
jgi:5-methylcytosine-specific restriction endonuclease McrA